MLRFYSPLQQQKSNGFQVGFLGVGGIKWEHWSEMGLRKLKEKMKKAHNRFSLKNSIEHVKVPFSVMLL